MPSKTKKQAKFMAAVANNPKFAKKAGVPQSVGKDFAKADKGKTFKEGGMPSYFESTKGKPGKAVKKYNKGGRLKSLRNEVEESRRVADTRPKDAKERKDKSEELSRINREEKRDMKMGGKVEYKSGGMTQGYNARLDDSMGARNGKKSQGMAARRNESKGMEKARGKGAYSGASTMMASGGTVKGCDGMATQGLTRAARQSGTRS